jgi:hypothetical protein
VFVSPAPHAPTPPGGAASTVSVATPKINKEETEQRIPWHVFIRYFVKESVTSCPRKSFTIIPFDNLFFDLFTAHNHNQFRHCVFAMKNPRSWALLQRH